MRLALAVAAGGALGALARYLLASGVAVVAGEAFPLGTLVVNLLGSTLLGVFIEVSGLYWSPSPELRALIVIGFLGAFTTFSTFAAEVVSLNAAGQSLLAVAYILLSLGLCLGGFRAGERLVRAWRR